jgi:hypothetical protein
MQKNQRIWSEMNIGRRIQRTEQNKSVHRAQETIANHRLLLTDPESRTGSKHEAWPQISRTGEYTSRKLRSNRLLSKKTLGTRESEGEISSMDPAWKTRTVIERVFTGK